MTKSAPMVIHMSAPTTSEPAAGEMCKCHGPCVLSHSCKTGGEVVAVLKSAGQPAD
jgi:hypothetical protein